MHHKTAKLLILVPTAGKSTPQKKTRKNLSSERFEESKQ